MEKSFWQSRWDENKIGFHLSEVNPLLESSQVFRDLVAARPGARVLVPLCGKTLDLLWLAEQGFEVVGVEFVQKAITDFFSALGETPREFSLEGRPAFEARGITLVAADFYAFSGEQVGEFDAIYDRAALVAVSPEQRAPYALQLAKLAKPGAPLLLMSFLHDIGSGPPHSIPEGELTELLGESFAIHKEFEQDVLAQNERFRERGATYLKEQLWEGARS